MFRKPGGKRHDGAEELAVTDRGAVVIALAVAVIAAFALQFTHRVGVVVGQVSLDTGAHVQRAILGLELGLRRHGVGHTVDDPRTNWASGRSRIDKAIDFGAIAVAAIIAATVIAAIAITITVITAIAIAVTRRFGLQLGDGRGIHRRQGSLHAAASSKGAVLLLENGSVGGGIGDTVDHPGADQATVRRHLLDQTTDARVIVAAGVGCGQGWRLQANQGSEQSDAEGGQPDASLLRPKRLNFHGCLSFDWYPVAVAHSALAPAIAFAGNSGGTTHLALLPNCHLLRSPTHRRWCVPQKRANGDRKIHGV